MKGEMGVIAPGAYADIIAVSGAPLRKVEALKDIKFVMKNGSIFRQ